MKKGTLLTLSFLTALWGFLGPFPFAPVEAAFAKPPPWAPAHGYRRKHHDEDEEIHHVRRYDSDREDWQRRVEEEMEQRYPHYREFETLDRNHDGRITIIEWVESRRLFEELDRNRDGRLSPGEYARIGEHRGLLSSLVATVKEKVASFWDWLF